MVKKICVLKGSPRKNGNTNSLLNVCLDVLKSSGMEVIEFDLYDMKVNPCIACRKCQEDWTKVECAQQDGMSKIFDAVMASDLILLATPIYSWYCTPPMKCALDRLVYAMNMYYGEKMGPSLWTGKEVAAVVTCGYRPEKGADLFDEGLKRFCKHSQLKYLGMLSERHQGYHIEFMDDEKRLHAVEFANKLMEE